MRKLLFLVALVMVLLSSCGTQVLDDQLPVVVEDSFGGCVPFVFSVEDDVPAVQFDSGDFSELLFEPEPEPEPELEPELAPEEIEALYIESLIGDMSLEERISQMFILSLRGEDTAPSEELERFVFESGVGGYVLFRENITTVEGTRALIDAINASSAFAPFICIDEEGGIVSRLRSASLPGYAAQPSARNIGATGDVQNAFLTGETIGSALASIGVNVNFAPVADVLTNSRNTVIGSRAFGSDPELVGDMAVAFQSGLRSQGVMSSPKHFPGHGNTASDTHLGQAVITSDRMHLASVEYVPFMRLIGEGAEFIMTGHIVAPSVDPESLPASLSKYFVTEVLRNELGFEGIIITDAMNMGAITLEYTSAQAAVLAIQAGVDIILMPKDFNEAKAGVLQAIDDGKITSDRISESVSRILQTKLRKIC